MADTTDTAERRLSTREEDGGADAGAPARTANEARPEPGPGFIRPPALEQFSNAAYLAVGPEIRKIIDKVLKFPELKDVRGIEYLPLWRRSGKPHISADPDDRRFAGVEIVSPLDLWAAAQHEVLDFPHYYLNLYWLHLDELREESQFVATETLERHIFMALLELNVSESGVLQGGGLTLDKWATVVAHYGPATPGLVSLRTQLSLWGEKHPE